MSVARRLLAALVLASGIAVAVFGLSASPLQAGEPPLEGPLAGNFTLLAPPVPAPDIPVTDAFEKQRRLADYKGGVLLVNFWATWCAPCVYEMPSLNRLQADLGDEGLTVMAVSVDRQGLAVVQGFYEDYRLDALDIFLDPLGELATELGVKGLPTSFLLDKRGRVVGKLQGSLEWDIPEVKKLVRYYLSEETGTETGAETIKASFP
ncbi:MAG: TlpA disulfide reductase family protein [Limibacillus sp.]